MECDREKWYENDLTKTKQKRDVLCLNLASCWYRTSHSGLDGHLQSNPMTLSLPSSSCVSGLRNLAPEPFLRRLWIRKRTKRSSSDESRAHDEDLLKKEQVLNEAGLVPLGPYPFSEFFGVTIGGFGRNVAMPVLHFVSKQLLKAFVPPKWRCWCHG